MIAISIIKTVTNTVVARGMLIYLKPKGPPPLCGSGRLLTTYEWDYCLSATRRP